MRKKNKPKCKVSLKEKLLKRTVLLLYEDYDVSEKELEECKRILENLKERPQSVS